MLLNLSYKSNLEVQWSFDNQKVLVSKARKLYKNRKMEMVFIDKYFADDIQIL